MKTELYGVLTFAAVALAGCSGEVAQTADRGRRVGDPASSAETVEVHPALACDSVVGFSSPLRTCQESTPCTALSALESAEVASTATKVPTCRTAVPGRAQFDDHPPAIVLGDDQVNRYACVHTPRDATPDSPRPLLVWFHGAFGTADDVYNATSLLPRSERYDLSGDPRRPGFILVSVQGRNLAWPTADPRDGSHHDIYHRDLSSPSPNPDVANVDRLIDTMVAEGNVDPSAIYVMGWSNGGAFAQLYGIARHETPTLGDNRVAAVAVYTAADPFHDAVESAAPSCRLDPYPMSAIPLMLVSRACDIVPCSDAQAGRFRDAGRPIAPGAVVDTWIANLRARVGVRPKRLIVDGAGKVVDACTPALRCLYPLAALNHVRWPDGVADNGSIDHEPAMLDFLRLNRLP